MPALVEEFPDVHQTFNLVPSLLLQLEEYARGEAQRRVLRPGVPSGRSSDARRTQRHRRAFFPVPVRTMMQPFPRYFELYERRQRGESVFRRRYARHSGLVDAGLDGSRPPAEGTDREGQRLQRDEDKGRLRGIVREDDSASHSGVSPNAAGRQSSRSRPRRFYHPILPLLIDSHVDDPNVPVDVRFRRRARAVGAFADFMRERFGEYPNGLWPSEGSVSDDVALLAARRFSVDGHGRRHPRQVRSRPGLGQSAAPLSVRTNGMESACFSATARCPI